MKFGAVLFLSIVLLTCSFPAFAQDASKESFYRASVDKCVNKFECKAHKIGSDRSAVKRDAAVASLKAEFIKSHRDRLIGRMSYLDVDTNQADVDYFITKSFGEFMGNRLDQAVADLMKERSAKEVYEAYSEEK